jgi:hypothetical protein
LNSVYPDAKKGGQIHLDLSTMRSMSLQSKRNFDGTKGEAGETAHVVSVSDALGGGDDRPLSPQQLCAQDFDFIEQIERERNARGVDLEIAREAPGCPDTAQ